MPNTERMGWPGLSSLTRLSWPWGQLLADTGSVTVSCMEVKVTTIESWPSTVSFICSLTCKHKPLSAPPVPHVPCPPCSLCPPCSRLCPYVSMFPHVPLCPLCALCPPCPCL